MIDIAKLLLKRGSPGLPSYRLLIRKCDHAMLLLDQRSREPVPYASIEYDKRLDGYYAKPEYGSMVYLLDDEIKYVDEFPERRNSGKAEV